MVSYIQYTVAQLKHRFIESPIKYYIYYLSPVVIFIIGWILGKMTLEKETVDTKVTFNFIPMSMIGYSLYLVFVYRMAYEIIKEKKEYRRQYMHTYGFSSFKFHLSWVIIYAILILPSSLIITGLIFILGVFPKIDITIIFLSLYTIQYGSALMYSLWVSSFFRRSPVIGGIVSILVYGSSAISTICSQYFFSYKRGRDHVNAYNTPNLMVYVIHQMRNAVIRGESINWFNIIPSGNYNILISIAIACASLIISFIVTLIIDVFFISSHMSRKPSDSKKSSYYERIIEYKLASKLGQFNNNNNQESNGRFFDWKKIKNSIKSNKESNPFNMDQPRLIENSSAAAIVGENLFKEYSNGIMGISNVSLNIYPNEIFMITGPKNSGKSTLMKMLYGRHRSSYGKVIYNYGKDKFEMNYRKWSTISCLNSYAPKEDYMFIEDLTVSDHINLYESMCSSQENGFTLLNELNFLGNTSDVIKNLDTVEKTKVKIVLALMKYRKYIFLEEPTKGMSEKDKICFWKVIRERKSQHVIVISTESVEEASQQADRVLLLNNGMIHFIGESEDLKHHSTNTNQNEHQLEIN